MTASVAADNKAAALIVTGDRAATNLAAGTADRGERGRCGPAAHDPKAGKSLAQFFFCMQIADEMEGQSEGPQT